MKEELQEILDDHKSQIIDMVKEDAEEAKRLKTATATAQAIGGTLGIPAGSSLIDQVMHGAVKAFQTTSSVATGSSPAPSSGSNDSPAGRDAGGAAPAAGPRSRIPAESHPVLAAYMHPHLADLPQRTYTRPELDAQLNMAAAQDLKEQAKRLGSDNMRNKAEAVHYISTLVWTKVAKP